MLKVLLADDSPVFRERFVEMLDEYPDIKVIAQAENTLEAADLVRKLQPDVVILDIRMPGGGGIILLQSIKRGNFIPKVIMLTNYPTVQYRRICKCAGADYFFDKATEFDQVAETLNFLAKLNRNYS